MKTKLNLILEEARAALSHGGVVCGVSNIHVRNIVALCENRKVEIIPKAKAPPARALPANWQKFKDALEAHDWECDQWSYGQPFFMTVSSKEASKVRFICRKNKVKIVLSNEDIGLIIYPQ